MRDVILQCKDLEKSFGRRKVLDGLSIDIHRNETLGLIGRSGGGKSTFLKCLIGYHSSDAGKIIIDGQDISRNVQELRKKFGYTTQENSFYEKLTVRENMKYYAHLYDLPRGEINGRIQELLRSVELESHARTIAQRLSGGQRRRLDFAISLLHKPSILILDEPTTGLDPLLVEQFWNVVNTIKKEGNTIIVSSHILSELAINCDRIAVFQSGRITQILERKGFGKLEHPEHIFGDNHA